MTTVLNSLNQCLETALAKPESLRQTLCRLVEELGNKQNLTRLLQAVLLEPAALREVASRSYRHPNGYDKIVLCSTSEIIVPYEARLHIWWSDTERPDTPIHDHGWDFASMVLSGRLECQEYEVGEGGLPMYKCSCSRSAKNIYELRYAGIDEIRPTRKYSILPHSPYFLEATTLHRAAGG
ncbi:MAG TPA: hypothetical protein VLX28_07410, partial [Thermoanaerobaculia bacterium]|nr:hypothetical protein [Thermoanaerobaculia bacterium]